MNLVEALKQREFEKNAEEIFLEAFIDELDKLGYNTEISKEGAQSLGKAFKWIAGRLGSGKKIAGETAEQIAKRKAASKARYLKLQAQNPAYGTFKEYDPIRRS